MIAGRSPASADRSPRPQRPGQPCRPRNPGFPGERPCTTALAERRMADPPAGPAAGRAPGRPPTLEPAPPSTARPHATATVTGSFTAADS